jgi:hypothetical protein
MSISRGVREGEFSQDVASHHRTGGQKKNRHSGGSLVDSFRLFYRQVSPEVQGLCREPQRHQEIVVDWLKSCRLAEVLQHDIE